MLVSENKESKFRSRAAGLGQFFQRRQKHRHAAHFLRQRNAFFLRRVFLVAVAFLFGLSILWETVVSGKSVPGYPSLVVGLMTIGGVQLIMIGVVGEYIGKILSEIKARPIYFIAEHSIRTADTKSTESNTSRTAAE